MPVYVRGMVISDVALTHRLYQKLMLDMEELVLMERRLAVESGAPLRAQATITMRALSQTRNSYRDFNARLRASAQDGAISAIKGMEERLARHERPSAGGPSLASLVRANPLPPISGYETGAVGVADVAELNKAINRHSRGYGTFWSAIEYGTGQHGVPSQVGRVIYGSFVKAGGGDPTPPMSEYGGGGGPHPIFLPGYQPGSGRTSGLGTIAKEIEGKHFIEFGAAGATVQWRKEIMATQQRAIDELAAIRLRS